MKLSCRFLKAVGGVNIFEYETVFKISSGSADTVYLQLVDENLDGPLTGVNPSGRRYCPPATTGLTVQIDNLDDSKKIVRQATQPYTGDASIWSFPVLSTDPLDGTLAMTLVLTEPTRVVRSHINVAICGS